MQDIIDLITTFFQSLIELLTSIFEGLFGGLLPE
jgi:hypothetical protein